MQLFHCNQCGHIAFFDNVVCVHCGTTLAYAPKARALQALVPLGPEPDAPLWRSGAGGQRYRMCANRLRYQACNFAVRESDPNPLCLSCRQTQIQPDLSVPGNLLRWQKIEAAKRQLFYTLSRIGVPIDQPDWWPRYEFLADVPGQPAVMTGHANGVITLNIAEADDDERARRRVALHEPYRTLLGHLRHESGHFYWDRLVLGGGEVASFRALFGDEQQGYQQALQRHYESPPDFAHWSNGYVSAYACAHPWEDWAETWAHYLHMVDLLETAASYRVHLSVPGEFKSVRSQVMNPFARNAPDFETLIQQWVPLTLMLNSLNRSLGQLDAYPFALSAGVLDKLRYVHGLVQRLRAPQVAPLQACVAVANPAPDGGPGGTQF